MEKNSRFLLAIAIAALVTFLAGIGAMFQTLSYTPSFENLKNRALIPKWKKGEITGKIEIGPKTQSWVRLDEISNYLIGAVIASEDASFFGHSGVDLHELKEAIKKDLREKRWARGASTITQQVVKNVYLSQEKTLWRKFREILWAWELDKKLSKSEILCFYLNMAQWGPNIYGIGQAAPHYFAADPVQLTPRESAFLAMVLPGPEKYYAYFKKKQITPFAKKRIEQILKVMSKIGYLDEEKYQQALNESLWGNHPETITTEPIEQEEIGNAEELASAQEPAPDLEPSQALEPQKSAMPVPNPSLYPTDR